MVDGLQLVVCVLMCAHVDTVVCVREGTDSVQEKAPQNPPPQENLP